MDMLDLGEVIAFIVWISLIVLIVAIVMAISFFGVAGLLWLWIKLFGEPETFWGAVLCAWVIASLSSGAGILWKKEQK